MSICIFSHGRCLQYDVGHDHPESASRLHAVQDQLLSSGLAYVLEQRDGNAASRDDLYLAHDRAYVDSLFELVPEHGHIWLDDDTQLNAKLLRAALYSAGCGISAIDYLMQGADRKAFCLVRPPGHHAERAAAKGFCLFNNIAIAAAYALERYKVQRILIVDFDVHHGNGTEDIFQHEARVRFFSSFQHPYYPYTDPISRSGSIIKMPLDAGTSGALYRQRWLDEWLPLMHQFQPELVLVSAGFDAHIEDEMGQMKLTDQDYFWLGQQLAQLAARHSQGRLLSMLEGGYEHSPLARSVVQYLKGQL
ncbi:histone deacetylase family protein [Rheinheimera sp.]|uniref:histone deacetylase family protein n=1 Tax=Rheinheimera sp. TaxID=1869214 RepID=UPI00307D4CE9